jgi:hypothetical protein
MKIIKNAKNGLADQHLVFFISELAKPALHLRFFYLHQLLGSVFFLKMVLIVYYSKSTGTIKPRA